MPFSTVLPDPGEFDTRLRVVTLSTSGAAGSRRQVESDGDVFWASVRETPRNTVATLVRAGRSEAVGSFEVTTYYDGVLTEHIRLKDEDQVFSSDTAFRFAVISASGTPGEARTLICRTLTG